jgi:hypothetical protein
MLAGDGDRLADILSDDLYYAHSSGTLDDKQSFLDKLRTGFSVYRKLGTQIDMVVPLGAEGLQANGVLSLDVVLNGTVRQAQVIYLVVWRREDGVWRLVGHQSTALPPPASA